MPVDLQQFALCTVGCEGDRLGHTGAVDAGGRGVGAPGRLHRLEVNDRTISSRRILDDMGVIHAQGNAGNTDKGGTANGGVNGGPFPFRTGRFGKCGHGKIHIGEPEADIVAGARITGISGKSIDSGHAEHESRG